MFGITKNMLEDYSHYSIVKDLLRPLLVRPQRRPKFNTQLKKNLSFECSTSGGSTASTDLRVSDLVALTAFRVALLLNKNFNRKTMVEVRRLELLTSGLQSPRSAN
jgi:hypothetical protein